MATTSPLGPERWNALEGIFEKRVASALARLGLPDAEALERLEARVAALEQALARQPKGAEAEPAAAAAKKPATRTKRTP